LGSTVADLVLSLSQLGYGGAMSTELHEIAAERLAADAQRYTTNRKAIVEILAAATRPLALSEVLGADNGLAQSSVYRNLVILQEAGIVRKVVATDEFARYELAEDLTEHHHHMLCTSCGAVEDFTLPERIERTVESALVTAAHRSGFTTSHHRLDLVGLCSTCHPGSG
jgi:Fur family transcriptional regulator, ferric uptake regulator